MLVWHVELIKVEKGYMLNINEIDISKGKSKIIHYPNKDFRLTFSEIAEELYVHVLDKKPDQIIFDSVGLHLGLKDNFISKAQRYENFTLLQNEMIEYSKVK